MIMMMKNEYIYNIHDNLHKFQAKSYPWSGEVTEDAGGGVASIGGLCDELIHHC